MEARPKGWYPQFPADCPAIPIGMKGGQGGKAKGVRGGTAWGWGPGHLCSRFLPLSWVELGYVLLKAELGLETKHGDFSVL